VVQVKQLPNSSLNYYGQQSEQYHASITVKLINLAAGNVVAGPKTSTLDYTSLNLKENLRETIAEISKSLLNDLKSR
jgi:hypothetical protein